MCTFITEANSSTIDPEESGFKDRSAPQSASGSNMPLENTGKVKFDPPSVPVIFVLGN